MIFYILVLTCEKVPLYHFGMDYRDRVKAAVAAFYSGPNAVTPKTSRKKPAKSSRSDIPTEAQVQSRVAALLDQLTVDGDPILWCHPPNESYGISKIAAGRRKLSGVKRGVPDLLIFTPGPLTGRPLAIELKRLKFSSTTPEQRQWLERLSACGWDTAICKGFSAAFETLKASGFVC